MTSLKEAQALTQSAVKFEKVNRMTQIRNLKTDNFSMPHATEMIGTYVEDSNYLTQDTEMIDDTLARFVPSGEELVDHLDAKFIRTSGCPEWKHV